MRAVQINRYGGIEEMEINKNAPAPSISNTQVLVEVHCASLNPVDFKIRRGDLRQFKEVHFPMTMGGDFAGIVVSSGSEVTGVKAGDMVYGSALVTNGGSGALAEFAACNRENIYIKPQISCYEAAALPLTGCSAIQALFDQIQLKASQKILIHGGAGGIGSVAIQIAKTIGAFVAATASEKSSGFVKELGADLVIDYKKERFEELLKEYDAVLDNVGGDTYRKSFEVLRKGGVINSMLERPDKALEEKYKVKALHQFTVVNAKRLSLLSEYVESGKIKINVGKKFTLDKTKEAFEYFETGHSSGKIVLKIQ